LRWSTTNEINNKGYDIERSEDGSNFFRIGFVDAKRNISSVYDYTFTDINFKSGANFYRLKQIDIGSNFKYSRIIKIKVPIPNIYQAVIAPNPFSNVTTISFSLTQSANVSLKIFDLPGKLITTLVNSEIQAGVHEFKWEGNKVSAGIYFLRIEAGNYSETRKIFVIH
jgi:hypothetical protein